MHDHDQVIIGNESPVTDPRIGWPITGDSLPVSLIRYRRLIAYFSDTLQETIACFSDPFTLTISA